jgi:hypothetical protein
MAQAFPVLKLPDAPETIAFRAVETLLQSDPLLKVTMKSFRSWSGAPEDILDPTIQTCPYVRISPKAGASTKETELQHRVILQVGIQVAVAGSNRDQLFNLWNAVRAALYPLTSARETTRNNLGTNAAISKAIITQNGFGLNVTEQGLRMLIAQGQLDLTMLVMTP